MKRKTALSADETLRQDRYERGTHNRPTFDSCPSQLWYMNCENYRRFN